MPHSGDFPVTHCILGLLNVPLYACCGGYKIIWGWWYSFGIVCMLTFVWLSNLCGVYWKETCITFVVIGETFHAPRDT